MTELELVDSVKNKRVLFCGEKITDVYHYVKPLGRPTKDAILSVEIDRAEYFEGGVYAAIEHAKTFCSVDRHCAGHWISKERYVEPSHMHKLFQVYRYLGNTNGPLPDLNIYDAVVVFDYGHGMATPEFIASLKGAKYLAINVQTNSGNYGYNLATKYPFAHYLCVDEPEARLATQNRSGDIEDSLRALAKIAHKVVITLGRAGAIAWSHNGIAKCPAFTDTIIDTMGSGDAFFAITSLIAQEATMESLLRVGNAAGAIKAGIVGHRKAVTKDDLTSFLSRFPQQANSSV